jgi:large subunit ribosomal protein L10
MAITREKKQVLVQEVSELLDTSKLTAFASYEGVSVENLQKLRRTAREQDVTIKVAKNRLVRVAMSQTKDYKDTDTSLLKGQLLYAISAEDEVAPAQVLKNFAKKHPELKLAGGFNSDGSVLDQAAIQVLADLPGKDQLRGQFVGVLAAPMTQVLGVINGAQRGFAQVLSQRAEQMG